MNPASAPAGKHSPDDEVAGIVQASSDTLPTQADVLTRARQFAGPLLVNCSLPSGENELEHADGVAKILEQMGGAVSLQAVPYLVYAADHLSRPQEMIEQAFGDEYAQLALQATRLMRLQQSQRVQPGSSGLGSPAEQVEAVRKMLLAFSRDLRVILLRLASRLQTLRHYAATKLPVPHALAYEALHVLAPLANRLGIWQIKWEMEDLAFRFLEPDTYRDVARLLDEKRIGREQRAEELRRIVRDARDRGYSAGETIGRWEAVRKGEKEHIFPYQENADVMFNSALAYELGTLKPLVEPLLRQVSYGTPEHIEAKRLLKFLEWFLPTTTEFVPDNSILREFIGDSILTDFSMWKR